jgi:SAM-dependent methyltransferase
MHFVPVETMRCEPKESMDKSRSKLVWGATPAGTTHAKGAEPGSLEFFERVLVGRNGYEMPWLFDIVPFPAFRGRNVVEIGCGAGYDAYSFCRNGARYTGLDIAARNAYLTRKHLSHYGYRPNVMAGDAEALPLRGKTYDVAYSNGVMHHTPDIEKGFREVERILKSGGVFWVIVYHRDSIFYWLSLFVADHLLRLGFLKRTLKERLSMIEYTTSGELPLVNVYSRRRLQFLLRSAGFSVENVWVRKLLPEDMPAIPLIRRMWPLIPMRVYHFLGRAFGWYIIARAVKY